MPSHLQIQYTDLTYATKRGFAQAFNGGSMVDPIWNTILQYRKDNARALPLLSIRKDHFLLTSTEPLVNRYQAFEQKLTQFSSAYEQLSSTPEWREKFDRVAYYECLLSASKLEKVSLSDLQIKMMLNGMYRENNLEHQIVLNYRDALSSCQKECLTLSPDENFIGIAYGKILGTENLLRFYREQDLQSIFTTAVVSREYEFAPYQDIPNLMDSLFLTLPDTTFLRSIRAFAASYYFQYVKPFEDHNELVGVLLAKQCLAKGGMGEAAYVLPVEDTLLPDPRLKDVLKETQKYSDLTHFVLYSVERLIPLIDDLLNEMTKIKKETLQREFNSSDTVKQEASRPEVPPKEEEKKEEESLPPVPETKPEEKPEPIQEEPKEPTQEPAPKKERKHAEVEILPSLPQGNAIVAPLPSLSEKEIKETARYLLETNPSLRKGQAMFFASHCALGRYYTIQDYKKYNRCAYETARTSMDALADLGFYKKQQLKNKFVYTPIKQGGNPQ